MKKILYCIILSLLFSISSIYAQTAFTELNLKGKELLVQKRTEEAEKLFTQSIRQNKDADSYYQISRLYYKSKDSRLSNLGNEYILQALRLVPDNLEYRYLYLDYLEDYGSRVKREEEYRKIYAANPTELKALYGLAKEKLKEYEKYKDFRFNSGVLLDMTEKVRADLDSTEYFYQMGLAVDSSSYEGLYGMVRMYQAKMSFAKTIEYLKKFEGYKQNGKDAQLQIMNLDKTIEYLEKIAKYYPDDKDVHLQLGVYYYKGKKLDESFRELQKGLSLMDAEEKEDFVCNSVIQMLETKYSGELKAMSKEEKIAFIEKWWKLSDPFYLTENSERLIEHYVRVAYSNMFFGVPAINLKGWKSDRGQTYIRFGEPDRNVKLCIDKENVLLELWEWDSMPGFAFKGEGNYLRFAAIDEFAEIWGAYYNQKTGGTKSFLMPAYSSLHSPVHSLKDYNSIIMQRIQSYKPVLYGSKINVDFKIYCFNRLNGKDNGNIETYAAYYIPIKDTAYKKEVTNFTHEVGAFFFDQNFESIAQVRNIIKDSEIKRVFDIGREIPVNCVGLGVKPGKVSFAFDLKRSVDSSYFTFRKVLNIPMIKRSVLGMSDLVFTNNIELEKELPMGIKRGNISLYPNLYGKCKNGDKFYIYFEVYNLKMDENKEGNFEQIITLKPKGNEGLSLGKIIKGITTIFTSEEGKVSLTSNYKIKDENTQIYMQLDLNGYKTGKYDLIITINDKTSGKNVEKKVDLEII